MTSAVAPITNGGPPHSFISRNNIMYCPKCSISNNAIQDQDLRCDTCGSALQPEVYDLLGAGPYAFTSEVRHPQLRMGQVVEEAIREGENAIIEAGVGTGKTFAYLIPALASGKRTVISTATVNLQGQLIHKDLPVLVGAMARLGVHVTYAEAKGKGNYLCGLAAEQQLTKLNLNQRAARLQIAESVHGVSSGEISQTEFSKLRDTSEVSAESCIGTKCTYKDSCAYLKAKTAIKGASVVVTNHAMTGIDFSRAYPPDRIGPLLKEYDVLVVDEAHKAINYWRNAYTTKVSERSIDTVAKKLSVVEGYSGVAHAKVTRAARSLFKTLPRVGKEGFRILSSIQDDTKEASVVLRGTFNALVSPMVNQHALLDARLTAGRKLTAGEWSTFLTVRRLTNRNTEILEALEQLSYPNDANTLYIEKTQQSARLVFAPRNIRDHLVNNLYPKAKTVILTSATLAVGQTFHHIKHDFGIVTKPKFEVTLESPFNYDANAVLYLPTHLPDPSTAYREPAVYAEAIAAEATNLAHLTGGRVLYLFTSSSDMDLVSRALAKQLSYPVICQDQFMPAPEVLRQYHKQLDRNPVICGLKSFFEGISLEGDALRAVVIVKLPFPPMSDPTYQAACAEVGASAFRDVTLPAMIRDVKQASGRLLRTKSDVGIVAILDSRIHTKTYGRLVVNSLPFTQRTTRISNVITWYDQVKTQWANQNT